MLTHMLTHADGLTASPAPCVLLQLGSEVQRVTECKNEAGGLGEWVCVGGGSRKEGGGQTVSFLLDTQRMHSNLEVRVCGKKDALISDIDDCLGECHVPLLQHLQVCSLY